MTKLGFFDSGIGGLTVMRSFEKLYPDFDMVYFGDRANCPYGNKSSEEIYELVLAGVQFLISKGANIIILACNTAVSHAIWRLQNEVFPEGSGIKILGITLPGAEKVQELRCHSICVLATTATVLSGAYRSRVKILSPNTYVQEIALPGLVDEIEKNSEIGVLLNKIGNKTSPTIELIMSSTEFLEKILLGKRNQEKIEKLLYGTLGQKLKKTNAIIFGCTHYPLVYKEIYKTIEKLGIKQPIYIDPGETAAEKFKFYLKKHSEFAISQNSERCLYFSK